MHHSSEFRYLAQSALCAVINPLFTYQVCNLAVGLVHGVQTQSL